MKNVGQILLKSEPVKVSKGQTSPNSMFKVQLGNGSLTQEIFNQLPQFGEEDDISIKEVENPIDNRQLDFIVDRTQKL